MTEQLTTVPMIDAEVALWNEWLDPMTVDELFRDLYEGLRWEQSAIRIYGRHYLIPRLNAWYGDSGAVYRYSGTRFEPNPWTSSLRRIREWVEKTTSQRFNSVLANLYRNGDDAVGWHSDDEPELGKTPVIASVSLGAHRKFSFKHRYRADVSPVYLWLQSGSLLVMAGETQHYWRHRIPRTTRHTLARINLTFRLVREN